MRIIAVLSLVIALAACQAANEPPANQAAPSPDQQPDQNQRVQQTAPREQRNETAQDTAQRLVNLSKEVPQVKGATAVVLGKTAVVGIDVDQALDRARVGTIKYSVAEALKEDPMGARAVVTADADIVQRLREMNEDIRNGRPIAGIAEELADIVGRIMPQMPKDVQRREQPNDTTNEQRMNQKGNPNDVDPSGNDKIQPNQ